MRLSICIPTYNRAAFLGETLDSVISQAGHDIEIVVSDNASDDNTEEVVRLRKTKFTRIIYYRHQRNMGADINYLKVVELATGEYCWFLGSDDLIKPGAISKMLDEISSGHDIYLCDVTLCDYSMKPIRDTAFLAANRDSNEFDLTDKMQLLRYLSFASSNNALFCYLSAIAFKRATWNNIQYENHFTGTAYAHVFMLFSFLKTRCRIKYIPLTFILNRAGNDSFSNQGVERRYLLDFDGYLLLANELFSDDPDVRRSFLQVMTREHPWYRLVKLRSAIRSRGRWNEIHAKLLEFGYSRGQIFMCNILGQARFIVNAAVHINSRFPRWLSVRFLKRTA